MCNLFITNKYLQPEVQTKVWTYEKQVLEPLSSAAIKLVSSAEDCVAREACGTALRACFEMEACLYVTFCSEESSAFTCN